MFLRAFQVDAFTTERFSGNPASVVMDADVLSDEQMQQIAREFSNSETAFILSPDSDDHEVRIRYFTPTMEVPTCGHATISAHYVRAITGSAAPGTIWQKIGIGRLPVEINRIGDDFEIVMTQGKPEFSDEYPAEIAERLFAALGISRNDLDPRFPIQRVDTGNSKILVAVSGREVLHALKPRSDQLIQLHDEAPNRGVYVFTVNDTAPGIDAHARMFAPQMGIEEDPVTGNGAGPLGAFLARTGYVHTNDNQAILTVRQGEAIGRPGDVKVMVDLIDGELTRVRVTGRAVIAFETVLSI